MRAVVADRSERWPVAPPTGDPLVDIRVLRDVGQVVRSWHVVARKLADRADHPDYPLCQQRVLLEVGSRQETAMAELRTALDIDAGQLSRVVHDLAASGAVEIRQGAADRRRRTITVTEMGRRAYQQLDAAYDRAVGEMLGQLSDAEQTSLVTAMNLVRELIGTVLRRR